MVNQDFYQRLRQSLQQSEESLSKLVTSLKQGVEKGISFASSSIDDLDALHTEVERLRKDNEKALWQTLDRTEIELRRRISRVTRTLLSTLDDIMR